ncbi:MAG: hypothetical protein QG649_513 [Patescibacteria group bacterium]|jgi:hypothetical protein|nr:hypothetical protein [Patescibacteria group bacterium]
MKDIDFDELDKAVNSLMSNVPQASAAKDESAAPVVVTNIPSSTPPVQPETAPPVSQEAPVSSPNTPRVAAPAARRSGRFMDMVHTSSDMTPRTSVTPQASREGIAITPRPVSSDVASPALAPSLPVAAEPVVQEDMPDPIALTPPLTQSVELQPENTDEEVSSTPALLADSAPLESPFITDAKVDKRPLNATPVEEKPWLDLTAELNRESDSVVPAAVSAETSVDTENNTDQRDNDEPPLNPQIPGLSSDLVAIEAGTSVELTQAVETEDAQKQVQEPAAPLGAASIPQQYKTQESSGDKSHAAIYDASEYPEPVTHPAKHRSGWLWVLWVILLLGLGAGGAFALYSFGIIP